MKLLACVSNHGFGHFGQTAPVLAALARQVPRLAIHIHTSLPEARLREMLDRPFSYLDVADDPGLCMADSLNVRVADTRAAYAALHADWPARLSAARARIEAVAPDVLLADVPYLSIAAARASGIPSVLLASFTWAHAYRAYCGGDPDSEALIDAMLAAYREADLILKPEPCLAMPELAGARGIGPLARLGQADRQGLRRRWGLAPGTRIVLVFLGGVDTPLPIEDWPVHPDIHWVFANTSDCPRADYHRVADSGLAYIDLLASADALITKPGYGSTAEAVCHGVPMLYVRRDTWPEEPALIDWLHQQGRGAEISPAQLLTGELRPTLEEVWARPAPVPPRPTGAEDAVRAVLGLLAPGSDDRHRRPLSADTGESARLLSPD